MKNNELNNQQIEEVKSLATEGDRLDYLNECGVELDDDMLAEVAGGTDQNGEACPNGDNHNWVKTRNRRKIAGILVSIYDYEYKCTKCGKCKWVR